MTTAVMTSTEVRVAWDQFGSKQCLLFTFPEQLDTEAATEAIRIWREARAERPGEKIILVWDCRIMKGYDSQARRDWQAAMGEMKAEIEEVWLVSGSSFVRMGAGLMGRAVNLPIRTANTLHEVK